ncbi:MAG: lipoyl(octanoyl) transferase LipB [Candidatus Hydrogenedentes bacterium]|nr:lipoyl(octanoyl) transferase LipB [Candidatus Hydrogenedentota bacterium]
MIVSVFPFEVIYFRSPQPYREIYNFQIQKRTSLANNEAGECLILLEHFPVYTAGKNFQSQHLLISPLECEQKGIPLIHTDRGGDITYHGPGQLVGYPITSLRERGLTVHQYLRMLETIIVECINRFGINATVNPPYTGVWIENRKISAIGIGVKDGITYHGFSINVNPDFTPFQWIIPCGIDDKPLTSILNELPPNAKCPSIPDIIEVIIPIFMKHFGIEKVKRVVY